MSKVFDKIPQVELKELHNKIVRLNVSETEGVTILSAVDREDRVYVLVIENNGDPNA